VSQTPAPTTFPVITWKSDQAASVPPEAGPRTNVIQTALARAPTRRMGRRDRLPAGRDATRRRGVQVSRSSATDTVTVCTVPAGSANITLPASSIGMTGA
jgi:hypothetical protein